MSTLYEIADQLVALDAMLTTSEGEITPEIDAWMTQYYAELSSKVDRIGGYVAELSARAEACTAEISRLQKRRDVQERKIKSMKLVCEFVLNQLQVDKLEGQTFTVARQKNGGKRALQLFVQPTDLPDPFKTTKTTVVENQDAIRQNLDESGRLFLDGTVIAELAPVTYSVRIK